MHTDFRQIIQSSAIVLALGTLSACGGAKGDTAADTAMTVMPAASSSTDSAMNMKWTTTLEPKGGTEVRGTASVAPGASAGTMMVEIAINGAPKGGTHPWHVHAGKCSDSGAPIVGPPSDYYPLQADAGGTATAMATVNVAAPSSGDYHVNVHLSPTETGTIVSCGDLKMAGM